MNIYKTFIVQGDTLYDERSKKTEQYTGGAVSVQREQRSLFNWCV